MAVEEVEGAAAPLSAPVQHATPKAHTVSSSGPSPLDSPLLVPATLLLAAYTVYLFPERGTAVLLVLGALATFGPTSAPIVCVLVNMIEKVALQASGSQVLHVAARDHMRTMLADPQIQKAFTNCCRASLLEAMIDERAQAMMVACCSEAMTTATIAASQDEDLKNTLNSAMRSGVKEALTDTTLIDKVCDLVKDVLRDPKMHAAAMKGAATAANPLKDLTVPTMPVLRTPSDSLKAMSSTLKEVMVGVEAKTLSSASGLSRAPPPTIKARSNSFSSNEKDGSPQVGPQDSPQ